MIADIFRKDYRQMTAQGVKFTPEDIVRLNALAVRAARSMNAASSLALPRLAFLPRDSRWRAPLVLREPTIAHDLWIEQAMRFVPMDNRNMNFLYGYALSREAGKLVDAFSPKKLIRTVFMFAAKRLVGFTEEQLSAAVDYCLFGADWTVGAHAPTEVKVEGEGEQRNLSTVHLCPSPSPTIGLLVRARALRLPISLDDAKRMTASELQEAIDRALSEDGKIDWEKTRIAALKPYVLARNEIRRRSATAPTAASTELRTPTPSNGSSSQGEAQ